MKKSNSTGVSIWLILLVGFIVSLFFVAIILNAISHEVSAQPREVHFAQRIEVSAIVRGLEVRDAEVTIITSPKTMLQAPLLKQSELYYPNVQLEVK